MKKFTDMFKWVSKSNIFGTKTKKRKRKIKLNKNNTKGLMKTEEALKVFNLEKLDVDKEIIDEKFKTMFDNNSLENGGSLYIQAKMLIARNTLLDRLGVDLNEKEKLEKEVEENMKTEEKGNVENQEKNEKINQDENNENIKDGNQKKNINENKEKNQK